MTVAMASNHLATPLFLKHLVTNDRLSVLYCRKPPHFCERTPDSTFYHVVQSLHSANNRLSHRKKPSYISHLYRLLGDTMWPYSTAAAVNEKNLATGMTAICDETLQLNDGQLVPFLYAQHRTDMLKQNCSIIIDLLKLMRELGRVQHALK